MKKQTSRQKWLEKNPDYFKEYRVSHRKEEVERVLKWRKKNKLEYNEYMKNLQRKLRTKKKK
jgi:hypothetical protein